MVKRMSTTQGYDHHKRLETPRLSRGRKGSYTGRWQIRGTVKLWSVIVHETQREVWVP